MVHGCILGIDGLLEVGPHICGRGFLNNRITRCPPLKAHFPAQIYIFAEFGR